VDNLGSTHVLTDSSGNIQEDIDYAPYGTEAYIATETSTNNYKFTRKERDTESGLDYFTARYDASFLGRFTSPDPDNAGAKEEDPQTWNAYSYVRDSPLILTDPTGLCSNGMDDAGGACQTVGQDVRTNDNPPTQQQMDRDQALSGNDPTVTLSFGNTSVTVTYQTGTDSTGRSGVDITATPTSGCDGCLWAQVVSRTGAGAEAPRKDGAGVGPLYGPEPATLDKFEDSPRNGKGEVGTFTATAILGNTNTGNKTFSVVGGMTYSYHVDGEGRVTMPTAPRAATQTEVRSAVGVLQKSSPDWKIH
jgi:RHS repeat-associated protein